MRKAELCPLGQHLQMQEQDVVCSVFLRRRSRGLVDQCTDVSSLNRQPQHGLC